MHNIKQIELFKVLLKHSSRLHRTSRTFGRRRLGEQKHWHKTVIKSHFYFSKALFSSIQFLLRGHQFHQQNTYLLRIPYINPASISVKEGLFSSIQHTLRNNSLHPLQAWIQLLFQLYQDFSLILFPLALYRNGRDQSLAPKSCVPATETSRHKQKHQMSVNTLMTGCIEN